jgi:hypothetical protein
LPRCHTVGGKWFWAYYQRADKELPKIPGDPD